MQNIGSTECLRTLHMWLIVGWHYSVIKPPAQARQSTTSSKQQFRYFALIVKSPNRT